MDVSDIKDFISSFPQNEPINQTRVGKSKLKSKAFLSAIFLNIFFGGISCFINWILGIVVFFIGCIMSFLSLFLALKNEKQQYFIRIVLILLTGLIWTTFFGIGCSFENIDYVDLKLLIIVDTAIYLVTILISYNVIKKRIRIGYYKSKIIPKDGEPVWALIPLAFMAIAYAESFHNTIGWLAVSVLVYLSTLILGVAALAFCVAVYMRHYYVKKYDLEDAIKVIYKPVEGRRFKKD